MSTTLETLQQSLTDAQAAAATAQEEKAATDQTLADTQAAVAAGKAKLVALVDEILGDTQAKLAALKQEVMEALGGETAVPAAPPTAPSEPAAPTTPPVPAAPAPEPTTAPVPTTPAPAPEPAPAPTPEPAPAPAPTDTAPAPTPAPTNPGGGQDVRLAPDPANGPPNGIIWQEPITVLSEMRGSDGKIHLQGHYRSLDPNVPPVLLNCGDVPVVVDRNVILTAGDGIRGGGGTNLSGKDLAVYGTNTVPDNLSRGHAVYAWQATNIDLQYLTQEAIGGVLLQEWGGNHTPAQALKVQNVRSRNIIGGDGGYRGGAGGSDEGRQYRHVLQLMNIRTKNMVLNWFESYNEAGKSRLEDGLNFYQSGGYDADNPLLGNGFFFKGSYPVPATDPYFTGCSLSFDGQPGIAANLLTDNIHLTNAISLSNGNAACNIPAHVGTNIVVDGLSAITSGYFPEGAPMFCSYAAVSVGDYTNGAGAGNFIKNLEVGFMRTKDVRTRADISPASVAGHVLNVTNLPDPITLAMEEAKFLVWRDLLNANNQVCGARFRSA